jgi:hypothetical protein
MSPFRRTWGTICPQTAIRCRRQQDIIWPRRMSRRQRDIWARRMSRRQANLIRRFRGQQTTILRQPRHRTQGRQRNRTLRRARSDRLPRSTSPGVFLARYRKANSSVAFLAPVRCIECGTGGPGTCRVSLTLGRTSLRLPSLSCQQTTVVTNILTF